MSSFLVSSKFSQIVSIYKAYGLGDAAVPAVGEQEWWVVGLVPRVEEMAETNLAKTHLTLSRASLQEKHGRNPDAQVYLLF